MAKIDFKKTLKQLYAPPKNEFTIVDVPEMQYLMIDGEGDPNNSPQFSDGVTSLYGTAYTIKFMISRKDAEKDYVVPPLEGLWWSDDMEHFSSDNKADWKWTLMIMQPDFVTRAIFDEGLAAYCAKNKITEVLQEVREACINEGI